MKTQKILAYGMAALLPSKPDRDIRSLFTLSGCRSLDMKIGDSYTTTGFNTSGLQPSLKNPMGNPPLGQGTTADGMNWVGYLATTFNQTMVLSYNFAAYGATVNDSIVDNEPEDLVYQVSYDFRQHYCTSSTWDSEKSLFAIWIGINDIQFDYLDADPYVKLPMILESYFRLLEELYECGARHFFVINVPPISQTPYMLAMEDWDRSLLQKVVHAFNQQLQDMVVDWRRNYPDTSMEMYDVWSFMTQILDHPRKYGFKDSHCVGGGCIWWDDYHPNSAFHRLLGADIQGQLDLINQ